MYLFHQKTALIHHSTAAGDGRLFQCSPCPVHKHEHSLLMIGCNSVVWLTVSHFVNLHIYRTSAVNWPWIWQKVYWSRITDSTFNANFEVIWTMIQWFLDITPLHPGNEPECTGIVAWRHYYTSVNIQHSALCWHCTFIRRPRYSNGRAHLVVISRKIDTG